MDMSPNQVRTATFSTVRKGWDPNEVAALLEQAADALEQAQNHATAMEARARAAVSKLQELTSAEAPPAPAEAPAPPAPLRTPAPTDEEREIISRTLLLAQRAADEAIEEARSQADRLVSEARDAARREGADERQRIRDEVDALSARRGFLESDVELLESFLIDQRERLRGAAASLIDMAEKVPGGLGHLRPPLMSAGDEPIGVDAVSSAAATADEVAGAAREVARPAAAPRSTADTPPAVERVRLDDTQALDVVARHDSSDDEFVIRLGDESIDPTPPGHPPGVDPR